MVARPEPLPQDRLRPHPDRLRPGAPGYDEILALHETAIRRGRTRYRDPATGLWAMTALYLWEQGYCCDSGCRHCPYLER
jgi:uncharacterized protein DUF5522